MGNFTYLRSSLSGDALLEVNYSVAWDALEDRYHNRKLIVKAYLDAIFGIESIRRESYEAVSLISELEKIVDAAEDCQLEHDSGAHGLLETRQHYHAILGSDAQFKGSS